MHMAERRHYSGVRNSYIIHFENAMPRTEPTSQTCLHRLNRRQRKKLRVGEFIERVFEVELAFTAPLNDAAYDTLLNAFIDLAESRNLLLCGFSGHIPFDNADGMISAQRGSVTEEDREAILTWLRARPEIKSVVSAALRDGWYGWTLKR